MFICIDFDGTIVDHAYPGIGKPVPGAIEKMKQFIEDGHKLILWTMRSGEFLEEAVNYLAKNGVELYGVNENQSQKSWTESPKAYGNVYIDDAAYGCPLLYLAEFNRKCVDWSRIEINS